MKAGLSPRSAFVILVANTPAYRRVLESFEEWS